jgi:DNA polymerase-1
MAGGQVPAGHRVSTVKDRLLLLDGHSLAYRAFYALPEENFATTTGLPTNAVYGFTAMLINVLRDEKPTHVAVAFDRREPTFRHQQYDEYKAGRTKTPDSFFSQLSLILEVLNALGVRHLSASGYEADDIIATLATEAVKSEMDVLIVTGDRDTFQLVNDHVTVLYNSRGVSDMKRYDPAGLVEKYGLTPAQYPDFAALRGDSSDNLPGIPGVGEKTATKWIQDFGTLQALVDRVDEVKGKTGDALRANLGNVLRNRQLTTLLTDLPADIVGATPADLIPHPWSREVIHQLFDTLQFRVLRDRLYQTFPDGLAGAGAGRGGTGQPGTGPAGGAVGGEARAGGEGFDSDVVVLGPEDVAAWLEAHTDSERTALAVTGSWARGSGIVTGLAIAAADGSAAYIDPETLTADDDAALGRWLADPECPKAIHDAKGPLHAMGDRGFVLQGITSDTALAAYLALPGQRTFDLADLALRYLGRELGGEAVPTGQLTLDGSGEEEGAAALARRARATLDLAAALDADLDRRGASTLLREIELPLVGVLAQMERTGIAADADHFADMSATLHAEVKSAEQAAYAVVGHEFNLGSPKQLQEVLFTELGLPKTKRIKTGYTTDSEALTTLLASTGHPVLEHLLHHRDVAKLKSIVDSLIPMANVDGRIHTTFNQMVAATGRLSSTDPNLQNIPIRTETGRRIREGFVVGAGFETLLTADYSQIELRIMADLSGDAALMAAFESGHDFHAATASRVFGVSPEDVTAEQRAKIKAMNYGLAYGLSAFGLSGQLRISVEEARGLMDEYFKEFGGIRDYLQSVVAQARVDGYTQTIMGRRRYLPDLTSDNRQRREMADRMALNAPIQGSAADVIKVAMLRVSSALASAGLRSRMLLQVHDELIFEVAAGELATVRSLVETEMGGATELRVPLAVSTGTGRSWAEAGH